MSLRHALLGMLNERSASGYDLLRTFDTSLSNVWPATQSQVYTELGKLTEAGALAVSAEGPRGRKEYTITEAGRAELIRWLADTETNRAERSELLLRVFFLGNLTAGQTTAFFRAEQDRAETLLAQLQGIEDAVDWQEGNLAVYGHFALDYGIRLATMRRDWAQSAIKELHNQTKHANRTTNDSPTTNPVKNRATDPVDG